MQRGSIALIILLGIALIGMAAVIVVYSQKQKTNKLQIIKPLPIVSSLPKENSNQIPLAPKNPEKFVKTIVSDDVYDNFWNPGLVHYDYWIDKNHFYTMKINSERLIGNGKGKSGMEELNKFLNLGQQSDFQDFDLIESVFRDYAGGGYHLLVKELTDVNYPGMDQSRAVMLYSGNGVYGFIEVNVYAKKGDNLVQLQSYLGDEKLYESYIKSCEAQNNRDFIKAEECYRKAFADNKDFERLTLNEANNLVKTFAIE